MKSIFKKFFNSNLPAIFAIVGGYLFLVFSAFHNSDYRYTICIFKNLTGQPCAGCGLGRSSIELFQGHFDESFHYHLLTIPFHIFMIIALVWLTRDYVKKENTFWPKVMKPLKPWVWGIIFALIALNWARALYLGI